MPETKNCITEIAEKQGRKYITPDDVCDALRSMPAEKVRLDLLEVLAHQTNFEAEDAGLCAFFAWKGYPV